MQHQTDRRVMDGVALPWVIPPPPATRAEECQWVIKKTITDIYAAERRLSVAIALNREAEESANVYGLDPDAKKALICQVKSAFCEMRYLRDDLLPQLRDGLVIARGEQARARADPAIPPKWQTDAAALTAHQKGTP